MSPNLVNVGAEITENGWRVFAHSQNFHIGRHCCYLTLPPPYTTRTYTAHTYQFPSSPWAGALDRHKGLSTGVQSRLDPCPQFEQTTNDTAGLTTWTLYNRQQANVGTCCVVARVYSLEQNAGRAHAGLCHASS